MDLPAPFGPSRPKISPREPREADVVDGREGAEAADEVAHLDHVAGRATVAARRSAGDAADDAARSPVACSPVIFSPVMFSGGHLHGGGDRSTKPSSKRGGVGSSTVPPRAAASGTGICGRRTMRSARTFHDRIEHRRIARPRGARPRAGAGLHVEAEHAALQRREEIGGRRIGQQRALMQQQHAVATAGLVQIGGRPDHAHALVAPLREHGRHDRPELAARGRIDADRGLVQQQQARPRQQRAGQPELLLHAAGELARRGGR